MPVANEQDAEWVLEQGQTPRGIE